MGSMRRDESREVMMNTETAPDTPRFLRFRELQKLVPVGRTTIWRWSTAGDFPRPYSLGKGVSAWREDEVRKWLETRARSS